MKKTIDSTLPAAPALPPVGAACMVSGGHVLQFAGLHQGGPLLSFTDPCMPGRATFHGWYEISRVLTAKDIPMLQAKADSMRARSFDPAGIEAIIAELK